MVTVPAPFSVPPFHVNKLLTFTVPALLRVALPTVRLPTVSGDVPASAPPLRTTSASEMPGVVELMVVVPAPMVTVPLKPKAPLTVAEVVAEKLAAPPVSLIDDAAVKVLLPPLMPSVVPAESRKEPVCDVSAPLDELPSRSSRRPA